MLIVEPSSLVFTVEDDHNDHLAIGESHESRETGSGSHRCPSLAADEPLIVEAFVGVRPLNGGLLSMPDDLVGIVQSSDDTHERLEFASLSK